MILGESGTGKSTSLRNFAKDDLLLIQPVPKPLPFKCDWSLVASDNPTGNIYRTDNSAQICSALNKTKKNVIVIDDFQYILANEFMRRVTDQVTGNQAFQKYNEIARNAWNILTTAGNLPENKRVYILSHTDTNESGHTKIKTIGKLLDDKIVLEGLVTIVLRTLRVNENYIFATQNSGNDTTKSPIGMFESEHIPNDLKAVDKAICEFYNIGE
jgi:hypothetical protein